MSKRDEAFELFNQGKVLEDSEVLALGVKAGSAKKYYRAWKRLQAESEAVKAALASTTVSLASLKMGDKFEYEGILYRKYPSIDGMIIGCEMVIPPDVFVYIRGKPRRFDPGTLVIQK